MVGAESRLGRLLVAARPIRPWLHLTLPSWWARVLIAAGAQADSSRVRVAMMADPYDDPGRDLEDPQPAVRELFSVSDVPTPATQTPEALIWARLAAFRVANDLDRARDLARDRTSFFYFLTLSLTSARDQALDLTRSLTQARALDLDLDLDRDSALAARDRDREALARDLEALARDLDRDLDRDRDLALEIANWLMRRPLDASGADLSYLPSEPTEVAATVHEALAGVRWNRATRWPPHLQESVMARSEEIAPGIYQVRDGTERAPHETVPR